VAVVPSAVSGSASRVFFWRAHALRSKSEEPFPKKKISHTLFVECVSQIYIGKPFWVRLS
jgi:hypothetical protein